jgi:uncharacterized protein YcgI (DUF1989 family)
MDIFVTLRKEFLENLLLDQSRGGTRRYIWTRCECCINHSVQEKDGNSYHICNDNWSELNVGEHIIYCETVDMCLECNGFKHRKD